eukprot:TRINITY_DN8901_c0_g1_i1.p1 TRINITY_DN8901_c0_g1~~TRINITY_DN8901_c0_g1_i1.p1  ORF type:complete len:427 (-),score=188.68 TRINITY_DN8901_c0_g1_i1:29-1309(-)
MSTEINRELIEKYEGCLFGLAVGDALGTTLEGILNPDQYQVISDLVGGGKFQVEAGQFTDDTSTALILAESLLQRKGFFPIDQNSKYLKWYLQGHLSSTNVCFDIGIQTRTSILKFKDTNEEYPSSSHEKRIGNGSLMRLAPIALAYVNYGPQILLNMAELSSRTTHGAIPCVDACRFFASLISGALQGKSKEEILDASYFDKFCENIQDLRPLCEEIDVIAKGSYKQADHLSCSGKVTDSLEAALWAFYKFDNFEQGCLTLVNFGNDADTTGAIYGQIAGAHYGKNLIPKKWIDKIIFSSFIEQCAKELLKLAQLNGFGLENLSNSSIELSIDFVNCHNCLLNLELNYENIKRFTEPGPNQFKTIDEFENAINQFRQLYFEQAPDCDAKNRLWQDWETKIIYSIRKTLQQRLNKPKINLFAIKKN